MKPPARNVSNLESGSRKHCDAARLFALPPSGAGLVAFGLALALGSGAAHSADPAAKVLDLPMRGAQGEGADAGADVRLSGKVVETMNAGGYTYVRVETGGREVWAAGPATRVAVGDTVSFERNMLMRDYYSKSLDRTFDEIYFAGRLVPAGSGEVSSERRAAHGSIASSGAGGVDVSGVEKAPGGYTVAELYQRKGELVGSEVVVRGKVVKVNLSIMGKNWLHLRDGSGTEGSNDLTVTTAGKAELGEVVLVRGKLATDRDFGFGYRYDLMIEDASVTVE